MLLRFSNILQLTSLAGLIVLGAAPLLADSSLYDFTLPSIEGAATPLSTYKGKVILLVNVASRCGFTPQYSALESLYEKYKDQGLVILGFPANNFGAQEPGTNAEIKTFCTLKYNVTFPMFSKVSVKGDDTTPLYQYLTQKANPAVAGEIKWNFTKFLVNRQGRVVARFEPPVTPDSPQAVAAVEKLLKQEGRGAGRRRLLLCGVCAIQGRTEAPRAAKRPFSRGRQCLSARRKAAYSLGKTDESGSEQAVAGSHNHWFL